MKTKKVLFRALSVFLFILMLSFTSCEAMAALFGCYSCTNANGDSTTTCFDDEAEQLENSGWSCNQVW